MTSTFSTGTWLSSKGPDVAVQAMDGWRELPDGHPSRQYTRDPAFGTWLFYVNRRIARRFGLSFLDLGDAPWRDYHDDGPLPEARRAMAATAGKYLAERMAR